MLDKVALISGMWNDNNIRLTGSAATGEYFRNWNPIGNSNEV